MFKTMLVTLLLFALTSPSWGLELSDYMLVDLTHPYNDDTIYGPTSPSSFDLTDLSFGYTPGRCTLL